MKMVALISALICLGGAPLFAGTWSAYLVDSKCYTTVEQNKSPTDTLDYVNRDRSLEVQLCSPNEKTKAFALVPENGDVRLDLDAAGNAKAVELVRKTSKRVFFTVTVTGQEEKNELSVSSITAK